MNSQSENKRQLLDSTQYALDVIDHYEQVFGHDFISPGGAQTARSMIASMGLLPKATVLDVGCGLGGAAFLMAREFGLRVSGIDLSQNMLTQASRRCRDYGLNEQVSLTQGDCLELDEEAGYDAVYSRDVFLHINDKPRLFEVLYRILKPGGKILFTDYCCGPQPWQPGFSNYVEQRGYSLSSVKQYESLVQSAGFSDINAEDITDWFQQILKTEIQTIQSLELSDKEKQDLLTSWEGKLSRAVSGDHRWGLVTAVKLF